MVDDDDDSRGKVWKGQTEVNQRPTVDDVQRLKVEGWMDPRKGRWKDSGLRGKEEGEKLGKRKRKERMGLGEERESESPCHDEISVYLRLTSLSLSLSLRGMNL